MSENVNAKDRKDCFNLSSKDFTQSDFEKYGKEIMNDAINPRTELIGKFHYQMIRAFIFGAIKRMKNQKLESKEYLDSLQRTKAQLREQSTKESKLHKDVEDFKELVTNFCEHAKQEPESSKRLVWRQTCQSYAKRVLKDLEAFGGCDE